MLKCFRGFATVAAAVVMAVPVAHAQNSNETEVVVYFGRETDAMDHAAREVLHALMNSVRGSVGEIEVAGHTATWGEADYNVGLSQRRANAVRDELVRLGAPAGQITTLAHGESSLARQTRDNVAEPLNERVVIRVIRPTAKTS